MFRKLHVKWEYNFEIGSALEGKESSNKERVRVVPQISEVGGSDK